MHVRVLIVGLCLTLFPLHVNADSASKHAKIKEIFHLSKMQARMEETKEVALTEAQAFGSAQLAAYALTQAQSQEDADYHQKIHALVAQRYDWVKMEPKYEQVYFEVFTEKELDGILQFYKSPAGQAYLSKAPALTKGVLELNTEQTESIKQQVTQLTKEHIARLKAAEKH